MRLYQGTHGQYITKYRDKLEDVLNNATDEFNRIMAIRLDLHYPRILDNGDSVCCFPNLKSGEISRFLNSLVSILSASEYRRSRNGARIYPNTLRNMWAKEYSQSGKCHYHVCLIFNKDAYYHLGSYDTDSLRGMIEKAWYSALGLQKEDCPGLVHFPENCRYVLDVNSSNFVFDYHALLKRLDYLTKVDSKVFGEGDRNFGCSRI
ncbi:inovirus Gp2 family protein [Klebsiella variicola]|uniref:inovirus Gp2 family protein n=1 Tax=Klebsiella variicola TaxID=244366 RepID=UPI0011E42406|nr:inovirus Gp2 family protein [Klebsiella variicola]TYG17471.1 inovirus Gp2 family protein [Klebsiella variicola]